MAIWKRRTTNKANKEVFHSSGMVAGSAAETLGSTNSETFEQRRTTDRNRQMVGVYRDAGVIHTYKHAARTHRTSHHVGTATLVSGSDTHKAAHTHRIDVVKGHAKVARKQVAKDEPAPAKRVYNRREMSDIRRPGVQVKPVVKPAFHEPTGRKYNPYQ